MANGCGPAQGELKCHRCGVCDGYGCPGMLPGLGGVFEGKNFQLNCEGWKKFFDAVCQAGKGDAKHWSVPHVPDTAIWETGQGSGSAFSALGYLNLLLA